MNIREFFFQKEVTVYGFAKEYVINHGLYGLKLVLQSSLTQTNTIPTYKFAVTECLYLINYKT